MNTPDMNTPDAPNDAESAQPFLPTEALSPTGISAMQGDDETVKTSDEQSQNPKDESGSLKHAVAAGVAGTVILASSLTLLDRIDFRSNAPAPDPPDVQQSITIKDAASQPPASFYLPAEDEPGVEYHLASPSASQKDAQVESSPAVVPQKSQHDLVYAGQPTEYGCVPTSVSMITDYWHQQDAANPTKSPQALLDLNAAQGEFDSQGMSATYIHDELSQMGYAAEDHVNAAFEDLQKATGEGPALAIVKLGMKPAGVNHTVVVTGISDKGDVQINDPWTGKSHTYTKDVFVNSWGADFGKGAPTRSYVTIRPAPR